MYRSVHKLYKYCKVLEYYKNAFNKANGKRGQIKYKQKLYIFCSRTQKNYKLHINRSHTFFPALKKAVLYNCISEATALRDK